MGRTTTAEQLYTSGSYLEKDPLSHTEESLWKAEQVTLTPGTLPRAFVDQSIML
jgi:hypothetical protein